MTEDKFEEFLKKAAAQYNVPPARTPRDEMWSAIQAQRTAGPRVVYGGGSPKHEQSGQRLGSKIWLGAAAAALLLVATGVGIGRWSASSKAPASVAAIKPTTAAPPATTEHPSANATASGNVADAAPTQRTGSGSVASVASVGTGNGSVGAGPSSNSGSSSAYQLTAVHHLSEAEALLTSFRTRSNADEQMDAQLGTWARQLLSTTRLLLDSPVAKDPQRRPLLEDLELVLVQIVQLSHGSTVQDRDLIEKTLENDHVMTRLRTAIPAGAQRGS